MQAAIWVSERRDALLAARAGIAFETVFSTQEKLQFLERAKNAGYCLRVFFVGSRDPRINASRVAGRMLQGRHAVPLEKILSRYEKSMRNLKPACALAGRVYLYDNSEEDREARLCARLHNGQVRKVYGAPPHGWVKRWWDFRITLSFQTFARLRKLVSLSCLLPYIGCPEPSALSCLVQRPR
jgi:predicted ABC-type ATPase